MGIVIGEHLVTDRHPDAAYVAEVPYKEKSRRLGDLHLHADDLLFAQESFNRFGSENDEHLKKVLFRSAVIHYFKCFASSARFSLRAKTVYENHPLAMMYFQYFKNLRNLHLVHDCNSYSQTGVWAVVGAAGEARNVVGIEVLTVKAGRIDPVYLSNFGNLMTAAITYVQDQSAVLSNKMQADLEKWPRAKLLALPPPSVTIGDPNAITKLR